MRITNKFQSKLIIFAKVLLKKIENQKLHWPTWRDSTQAANWITCFLTTGGKYLSTHSEHVTTQVSILRDVTGRQWPTTKTVYFWWCISSKIFLFFGHFYFRRKGKQTAVPNITTLALKTFSFWLIVLFIQQVLAIVSIINVPQNVLRSWSVYFSPPSYKVFSLFCCYSVSDRSEHMANCQLR